MTEWPIDFEPEPFRPQFPFRKPHVQTLVGNFLRSENNLTFRRERFDTPDGDFIDLDFADVNGYSWAQLGDEAPIVLALHGLEGNARRGYMCELYRQLAWRGIRPVGMNFRSCSGEINRRARFYNAGSTDDVAVVLAWLQARWPSAPKGIVGFSLGANQTLKFLGEQGAALPESVRGAAAVSPPFQMDIGIDLLNRFPGTLYGRYFLRSLHGKAIAKKELLADKVDLDRVLATRTIQEFDEVATAVLHGYSGAVDYYQQCSSARFLAQIQRPTLLLRAVDDPMIAPADIPHATIAANSCLNLVLTEHGGHVGFVEGNPFNGVSFWAERQVAQFMAQVFGL